MEDTPRLFTRAFAILTLAHLLQAIGWSSMMLFPLYVDALGASRAELGVIMAAAGVGGLVARPVVAWALDAIGRRPVILVGGAFLAGGMALVGLVRDIGWLIYVQRVVFGVGLGALFTGYFTFAADIIPASRRTEGIALFGVSGLMTLALNPFVEDLGFAAADLRLFYPLASLVVVAAVLLTQLVPEPAKDPDAAPFSARAALRALAEPGLRPVWLATLVFATLASVFMAFATVTAGHRGVARPAELWLTYALGAVVVRLLGSRLPDRVGPARFVPPSLGVYVIGILVCAATTSELGFMVAGLLAGVGHGYSFPVLMSQVVARSPAALRGSAVAMYTALWVVAELALTPAFGALADETSDGAMFAAVAAAGVAGLLWWALLERRYGVAFTRRAPR